jgi:hypothetical protein
MVAIASHHDLIVGRRADDEVRQINAFLLQALADERIGSLGNFLERGCDVLRRHSAI